MNTTHELSGGYDVKSGSYEVTSGSYDVTSGSYGMTSGGYALTSGSEDLTVDIALLGLLASIEQVRSIFSVLMVITGILTVLANILLFYLFMKFDYLRCKTNSYIISLSLFDLLCGVVMFNSGMINQFLRAHVWVREFCILTIWMQPICFVGSVLAMGGAAVEHYIHIVYPYTHARYAYSVLHPIVATSIWVVVIVLASVVVFPEVDWNVGMQCLADTILNTQKYPAIIVPTILISLVAIAICLVKILLVAQRHRKQLAEEMRMQVVGITNGNVSQQAFEAAVKPTVPSFTIGQEGAGPSNKGDNVHSDGQETSCGSLDSTSIELEENERPGKNKGNFIHTESDKMREGIEKVTEHMPVTEDTSENKTETARGQAILAEGRQKTAIIVTLISVTLLCWTPITFNIVLLYVMPRHLLNTSGFFIWGEVSRFLLTANSLINPLLYQRFSPGVKKVYRSVFGLGTATVGPMD